MREIFYPVLGRVKVCHILHGSSYLCEESLHTKFYRPFFFHVKKFAVGGWWVVGVTGDLCVKL